MGQTHWARLLGTTLLVCLVPFVFYYLAGYRTTRAYLLDRNQRAVAEVSARVEERVATLHKVLANSMSFKDEEPSNDDECQPDPGDSAALAAFRHNVCTAISDNRLLTFRDISIPGAGIERTLVDPVPSSNGRSLRLTYSSPPDWQSSRLRARYTQALSGPVTIRADIRFDDLFGPLNPHDYFDEASVVHSELGVLRPQSSASQGLRLAQFLKDSPAPHDSVPTEKSWSARLFGSAPTDRSVGEVGIGGEQYLVFRQPIVLESEGGKAKYDVVGMVRARAVQEQALALGVVPLLALLAIVLLVALSGPFIKAFLVGRYEPLRTADVRALKLALALGFGVVVMIVLSFAQLRSGRSGLDQQLERLTGVVERSLKAELAQAVSQLDAYRAQHEARKVTLKSVGLLDGPGVIYPALRGFVAIGAAGLHLEKRSITSRNTALINVSTRDYFEELQRGRFSVRCDAKGVPNDWCVDGRSYSMHAVRSRTTGENVTLVSRIVEAQPNAPDAQCVPEPAIVQLETQLPSLSNRIVPLGFSFALVKKNDGTVLHHSDARRSLSENVFVASDQDPALRTALTARGPQLLTVQYLGREQRARVVPLAHTPWTLIAFADTQYMQTMVLESALAGLAALACLLVLLLLTRVGIAGPRISAWATPSSTPERVVEYRLAAVGLAVLAAIEILLAILIGRQVAWISCLIALVALGGISWISREREPKKLERRANRVEAWLAERAALLGPTNRLKWSVARSHLTVISMLLVVTIILPTSAFFSESYATQRIALEQLVRADLHAQLERQRVRIEATYHKVEPRQRVEEVIAKQLDGTWYAPARVPEREFFAAVESIYSLGFWRELSRSLPAFNEAARRLRDSKQSETSVDAVIHARDSAQSSHPSSSATVVDDRDVLRQAGAVSTAIALPQASFLGDGVTMLMVALVCFFLYVFLVRVARCVLGLEREPFAQTSCPTLALNSSHVLHLCLPESGLEILKAKLSSAGETYIVDLRRADIPRGLPAGYTAVLLYHFECRIVGRDRTSDTLEALENLSLDCARIAICSDVDPIYYLDEYRQDHKHAREKAAEGPELPDVIRWAQLVSRFDRVHHVTEPMTCEEIGLSESEWTTLRQERFQQAVEAHDAWLSQCKARPTVPPGTAARNVSRPSIPLRNRGLEPEAQEILRCECGWDEELQRIARTMSAHHVDDLRSTPRLLQQITVRANARHRYLWSLCTITEKLLLVHLAREGTINPSNWSVAHMLATRGLLQYRRGRIALPSVSFERFVLEAMRPDDLARLERQQPSSWRQVSLPLLGLVFFAVGFFLWSQPGITEPLLAVLGAGAAGVTGALKFAGSLGDTGKHMRDFLG